MNLFVVETYLTLLIVIYILVNKKKSEQPPTVLEVLSIEMKKIYNDKDAVTLNKEFLERNSQSVLHRLASKYFQPVFIS